MQYEEQKKIFKKEILKRLEYLGDLTDEEIMEMIDELILEEAKKEFIPYGVKDRMRKELFYSFRKLDLLQSLVDDPKVTEIMVNGLDAIFIEKEGKIEKWDRKFESREKLDDVIQQIVANCNRVVNESSPIVDARLKNGSRVNVVLNPISLNGPILTIRRFPEDPMTMEKLLAFGSITKDCVDFLQKLVVAKYNIFISGGTGSGKTTFLNALSRFIPEDERIITIEDSAELQLGCIDNLVRLETRNANTEGCNPVTMTDLIKSSLRMRPDRIIVGEVRGKEALDLIQAYNTGHDGSISTGHANSAKDMFSRLEMMTLMATDMPLSAIGKQLAAGIDIIIHLGRLRDKSRKVLEICEVLGYEQGEIKMHPLYTFEEEDREDLVQEKSFRNTKKVYGSLKKKEELFHVEKLKAAGFFVD